MNQELLVKLAAIGLQHLQQEEMRKQASAVDLLKIATKLGVSLKALDAMQHLPNPLISRVSRAIARLSDKPGAQKLLTKQRRNLTKALIAQKKGGAKVPQEMYDATLATLKKNRKHISKGYYDSIGEVRKAYT